jgi:3'-5' exoribonuclease
VQAHHGSYGDVMPCTPEAWAVHLADLTSAQLDEVTADIAEITPGTYHPKGSRSGGPVFRRPLR